MKYPPGEIIWVTKINEQQKISHIITSKPSREFYFIYELRGGTFVKLGKAKSPLDLEKKFLSE